MSAPVVRVAPGDGLDVTAPLLDPEIQASASGASPANGDVWLCVSMTPRDMFIVSHSVTILA